MPSTTSTNHQPCVYSSDRVYTLSLPTTCWRAEQCEDYMNEIDWNDFQKVQLHVGTVVDAQAFPEAKKPAFILHIDFGADIGIRKSSAQITDLYSCEQLLGKQVLAVVNFPPKQIGPMISECLITGFHREDGSVVLAVPDDSVPNGVRLA